MQDLEGLDLLPTLQPGQAKGSPQSSLAPASGLAPPNAPRAPGVCPQRAKGLPQDGADLGPSGLCWPHSLGIFFREVCRREALGRKPFKRGRNHALPLLLLCQKLFHGPGDQFV